MLIIPIEIGFVSKYLNSTPSNGPGFATRVAHCIVAGAGVVENKSRAPVVFVSSPNSTDIMEE